MYLSFIDKLFDIYLVLENLDAHEVLKKKKNKVAWKYFKEYITFKRETCRNVLFSGKS